MIKNLVIVESPAKAKTIQQFLGPDYKVMSSYGHIRDLRKKNFSIDVENGFQPIYEIPEDKKHIVSELRQAAADTETIWLASDEDREGEAIAWHLSEVLGLDPRTVRRIVFHEITPNAILEALKHPRHIDLNRVNAQQARRVLDRIVGFELSPVLWKKIKPSLSAGRVQSVTVRLIVEREEEIKAFTPEPYFRVTARMTSPEGVPFRADLSRRLSDVKAARAFLEACNGASFRVADIETKPLKKAPAPPFTTSTLQQEASRKLGFTVSQTMMVAQRLYEAGHITYMRTDSLNLSSLAVSAISDEITRSMGPEYLKTRHYHTSSKGAQEAHEAIRPTYISKQTIDGTAQEKRLYSLIWKRTIASQMAEAQLEKTTATIDIIPRGAKSPEAGSPHFTASGEVIRFDGFMRVYLEGRDDEDDAENSDLLPAMKTGDSVDAAEIDATQRFTQQPPRYTEATLVRKLEELGIGRPSTYAPTISTIQQRGYVEKGERPGIERTFEHLTLAGGRITEETRTETYGAEKGKLIPTDVGTIVNRFLTEFFPRILDFNFTAEIEQDFDRIAEGDLDWSKELGGFYDDFHPTVEDVSNKHFESKVGERRLGVDPATGEPVSVKIGRYGPLVQIGSAEEDRKPRFASLLKDQSVETITLAEALKLFEFPRHLGKFEDKEVTVAVGRFGPYVRHDNKFVSIPKDEHPSALTLEQAIELIEAKRADAASKIVKTFDDDPDMQILNGRYGVYVAYKGNNFRLPKGIEDPAALTREEVLDIISRQEVKPKRRATRRKA